MPFFGGKFNELFRPREFTTIDVIVNSHVLVWNKIANWNDMKEHFQFQLGDLTLVKSTTE